MLLLNDYLAKGHGFLVVSTYLIIHALSASIANQPALSLPNPVNGTSNVIIGHCYTPASLAGVQETNPRDCREALKVLIRQPAFTTPLRFSKNLRRGIKVPRGWTAGQCIIFVSCENDRDAYTFRFADVAQNARRLIDGCVGKPDETGQWGTFKWGGVDKLLDTMTFYVSVGKPVPPSPGVGEGTVMALMGNGTMIEVEVE